MGRTGAAHGTVVSPPLTDVGSEVAVGLRDRLVSVGFPLSTVVASGVWGAGSGSACRLCGVQSFAADQFGACEARMSNAGLSSAV